MAILYLQCCAPKVLPGIASEVFNVVVASMMAVTSKIGLGSRSVVWYQPQRQRLVMISKDLSI